jgi:trans-aconitate 2-methyltransferase
MFQWNPQEYASHSAAQLVWARELIARLHLRGDEAILDIGCGDGKITAEFAAIVPRGRVLGTDLAAEMIDYARETFPPGRFPNLEFRRQDARSLEGEQDYDLIFSNAALHWVSDQHAVVLGAGRALRGGGRLVISCGGRGNASEILAELDTLLAEPLWEPYFQGFKNPYTFLGPEDYAPWLAEAGLEPLRLELAEKDMRQAGKEGLAAWIRTTWMPYTHQVPEELRERFINELAERHLARHPLDAAGVCHVRMVRLEDRKSVV